VGKSEGIRRVNVVRKWTIPIERRVGVCVNGRENASQRRIFPSEIISYSK
jgi:hypothetical protein